MRRAAPTGLLSWVGGHEIAVLVALAGIAAGVWIFALLAGEVMDGETKTFDESVFLALHQGSSQALQEAARDITALGGVAVLTCLTAIVIGFLALDGKGRMALFVCGSVLGGVLVASLLKDSFRRPRPTLAADAIYASGSSFPSGHSMMSAVTYLTLGALLARSEQRKRLRAYFLLTAALLSGLIGVTRVYLGVHWPTDVLAGWTAGAAWALLCWLVARRLQRRHTLEDANEH